ncbi:MAG: YggT family protein [Acidimicrobiia bacterium]|nr:YggT family protein [Acidimicrobiia bacterium]MDX2467916.1 YggT family protein [Acidimicrobiia bacterium]
MVSLICLVLNLAWITLFGWIILSYVVNLGRLSWGHPVRKVYDTLSSIINPILMPIRRILPPMRAGSMGLDLSPMVLFFGIIILQRLICR